MGRGAARPRPGCGTPRQQGGCRGTPGLPRREDGFLGEDHPLVREEFRPGLRPHCQAGLELLDHDEELPERRAVLPPHQVWKPGEDDPRGLGGDQINMALSSWNLLYGYLGDPAVKANMRLIADRWMEHGLAPEGEPWGGLPYPYNLEEHSGPV